MFNVGLLSMRSSVTPASMLTGISPSALLVLRLTVWPLVSLAKQYVVLLLHLLVRFGLAEPKITSVPTTLTATDTYTVSGTQLNGLTQGANYGDDFQDATNYPLVRITNNASGDVVYARTAGMTTMSVAPNKASSANFTVPSGIETGPSTLRVVANGIASAAVAVDVNS